MNRRMLIGGVSIWLAIIAPKEAFMGEMGLSTKEEDWSEILKRSTFNARVRFVKLHSIDVGFKTLSPHGAEKVKLEAYEFEVLQRFPNFGGQVSAPSGHQAHLPETFRSVLKPLHEIGSGDRILMADLTHKVMALNSNWGLSSTDSRPLVKGGLKSLKEGQTVIFSPKSFDESLRIFDGNIQTALISDEHWTKAFEMMKSTNR